jgi:hypothetical protein
VKVLHLALLALVLNTQNTVLSSISLTIQKWRLFKIIFKVAGT